MQKTICMRILKAILSGITLATLLTACGNDKQLPENTISTDFESLGQWSKSAVIAKGIAHSGLYSTFTDSSHEYSQTFEVALADLPVKTPKKITVKAWVMGKSMNTDSKLVVSVEKDGKSIAWQGDGVKPVIKAPMTWTEFQTSVNVGTTIPDGAILKIYGWNQGKEPVYFDDVAISLE